MKPGQLPDKEYLSMCVEDLHEMLRAINDMSKTLKTHPEYEFLSFQLDQLNKPLLAALGDVHEEAMRGEPTLEQEIEELEEADMVKRRKNDEIKKKK